ncbi:L-fucose dehydrogenase-like isoform X2 [Styela clava]
MPLSRQQKASEILHKNIRCHKSVFPLCDVFLINSHGNPNEMLDLICSVQFIEMAQRYQDKVALVTGGSKGIGKGIVTVFVQHGAKVCFCARDEDVGKKLEKELNEKYPGSSFFVKCDVAKEEDIIKVVNSTVAKFGEIDCLVNNAGRHPPDQKIDDISAAELRSLYDTNVVSYFLFAKYALPSLRKTKGNIINLSSLVGSMGQPNAVPYVSTKGAIIAMTKAMAIDEAVNGVRVNCISPGNVWTPMWSKLANEAIDTNKATIDGAEAQLMGRYGSMEESGNLALYIAAEATFTTGVDFLLTGGAELSYGRKTRVQAQMPSTL